MPKQPHFFCEYCGAEVRKDAKICPHCGRFFSSVKCPKCGHVGMPDDFSFGCPGCGYALPANPAPEPMKRASALPQMAPPLPWWAFVAVAAVLVVLIFALIGTLV
jgi:uncharacterized membrane protein YvbJ